MTPVFLKRDDLVEKHQELLDVLKWNKDVKTQHEQLIKAYPCKMNQGILDGSELTADIYIDNILGGGAFKGKHDQAPCSNNQGHIHCLQETRHGSLSVPLIPRKVARANSWP